MCAGVSSMVLQASKGRCEKQVPSQVVLGIRAVEAWMFKA